MTFHPLTLASRRLKEIARREDGAVTAEAIIWLPIFVFLLWLVAEASMAFAAEGRAMRVIEDANRMFASGYFQTAAETEDFIRTQLSSWQSGMTVTTSQTNKIILTTLTVPVTTMIGTDAFSIFSSTTVSLSNQQMAEG